MADPAVTLLRDFVAALQRNSRRESNDAAQALIAMGAPLRDKWKLVARVMQTNSELAAANAAMDLFVRQTGDTALARFDQAAFAAQTGRLDRANEIMRTVPLEVPDPASHSYILGTMALNRGEIEHAESHFLDALDGNPQLGQAMLALASSRKRPEGDPIGGRILATGSAMAEAPVSERAPYHFAAGRIHFDRGEADAAFADFTRANALVASERHYDPATDRADARTSSEGYNRALIERIAAEVETDTSEAIVVTGLPRSGTTLVEQILVSHSALTGGEELGRMAIVARDLTENSAAGLETYLECGVADDLTQLYLRLCRERFGIDGRYVDKGINNTRYIGLIVALLPQTPVVWLRRDPLDCALSAFRTYFIQGLDWSWKLEDIATHFRLEDELFAFWSELLPERILAVDYSALVNDPRGQIERILAHCDLPVEEGVFEPHKTERVVSTASAVQVREPINRKGVGSAGPFREHMKPFLEAYRA